jgi:hypothetical protein
MEAPFLPLFVDPEGRIRKSPQTAEFYSTTNRILGKRGDSPKMGVYFLSRDIYAGPKRLPPQTLVQVVVKKIGELAQTHRYLAHGITDVRPSKDGDPYLVDLPFTGKALSRLVAEAENGELRCVFEVSWSTDSGLTWHSTVAPVEILILDDATKHGTKFPANPRSVVQLPTVLMESRVFHEDESRVRFIDLRRVFNLQSGDVAHFKVMLTASFRLQKGLAPSPDYETGNIFSAAWVVCVNMADPENVFGEPAIVELESNSESPAGDIGSLDAWLITGESPRPDRNYGQSTNIGCLFSHAGVSAYSIRELIGTIYIELIGRHSAAADSESFSDLSSSGGSSSSASSLSSSIGS